MWCALPPSSSGRPGPRQAEWKSSCRLLLNDPRQAAQWPKDSRTACALDKGLKTLPALTWAGQLSVSWSETERRATCAGERLWEPLSEAT